MKAKQHLLIFICLCVQLLGAAQETKRIEIVANEDPKKVTLESCELQISATQKTDDKSVDVFIDIHNKDNYMFLFGKEYNEKELKKQTAIRFNKHYNSSNRKINKCSGIQNEDVLLIEPQRTQVLQYKGQANDVINCKLPFYIAIHKKKKFFSSEKFLISQYVEDYLNIHVKGQEPEPENDVFDELQQDYEELVDELRSQTFCPNRKHKPSLSEQEEVFQTRINKLENEISIIKEKNNWTNSSTKFKKYKELLNKLKEIHFQERDCGGHNLITQPSHSCNYDSWTPKLVLEKLETLYKKLDNGNVRKESAMEQAKAIQRKYSGGCPILKSKMDKDNAIKNKVDIYFDRIIKY